MFRLNRVSYNIFVSGIFWCQEILKYVQFAGRLTWMYTFAFCGRKVRNVEGVIPFVAKRIVISTTKR